MRLLPMGYLKARVYSPLPKTLAQLKVKIEREIKNIKPDVLKKVIQNFKKRCNLVIDNLGGHFENKKKSL